MKPINETIPLDRIRILTFPQILETAKTDEQYVLLFLAIKTGMRPGEYRGLEWKDIDVENRILMVRRAIKLQKGGGFYFTEPKTKKAEEAYRFRSLSSRI